MTDKSRSNNTMSGNMHLFLRVLILISTIVLIYFAIEERFRQNIPITVVILAILIFIERCVSSYGCSNNQTNNQNVEGFDRTDRLESLNAGRGKLGQFYVACRGCGRKKILQERVSSLYDQPPCGRYQTVGPCEGCGSYDQYEGRTNCSSGNSDSGVNRSYCIKDCADNIGHDTVSLWNDNYIDTNETFCYNCALDLKAKIQNAALNYRELPAINGPPGYSIYLDNAYNY